MNKNEKQIRTFNRQAKRGLRSRNRRHWLMWAKATGQLENYYYQKRFGMSKAQVVRALQERDKGKEIQQVKKKTFWQKIFIWITKLLKI